MSKIENGILDYKDKHGTQIKAGDKVKAGTMCHGKIRYSTGIVTWNKYHYTIKGAGFGFEHIYRNDIEIIIDEQN